MGRLGSRPCLMGWLGSEVWVSASFQKIPHLTGHLGPRPCLMGWPGSGVWVNASFQYFSGGVISGGAISTGSYLMYSSTLTGNVSWVWQLTELQQHSVSEKTGLLFYILKWFQQIWSNVDNFCLSRGRETVSRNLTTMTVNRRRRCTHTLQHFAEINRHRKQKQEPNTARWQRNVIVECLTEIYAVTEHTHTHSYTQKRRFTALAWRCIGRRFLTVLRWWWQVEILKSE